MAIAHVINGRTRDLGGGFMVQRILPAAARRHVGPFVFLDQMGPADIPPGLGLDVRPHPHIGLATVTYLFDGEILHRDSLGYVQPIEPGAVNWMTAGRGIVHSERVRDAVRARGQRLFGIQAWCALPRADEEIAPGFTHIPADTLPVFTIDGVWLRLLAGSLYGRTSPAPTRGGPVYLHAEFASDATLTIPAEMGERAIYVVDGTLQVDGTAVTAGALVVVEDGEDITVQATGGAVRAMVLGGRPLDGPRAIWWNLVSSRPERIEQAKADWKEGRFAKVPGDDEFIPLPEG